MPMRSDFGSDHDISQSIVPLAARANGTTNGTSVDCAEYHGRASARLESAAGTGTTPTLDVKLQESDDNSTWTDISGATFAQVTTAAAAQTINFDLDSAGRYVRAVGTIAGAAGGGFVYLCNLILPAGPQRPSPS